MFLEKAKELGIIMLGIFVVIPAAVIIVTVTKVQDAVGNAIGRKKNSYQ